MQDMVEHVGTLVALAAECDWCTEFGVRAPDDTSSTMNLLRGVRKGLTSYDIAECGVEAPQQLAKVSGKQFRFIRANSLDVEIDETDLLMIDSFHSYTQLFAELTRHAGQVRKFIVMHDTDLCGVVGEDNKPPGLQRAVVDFLARSDEWILHSHTWKCCGLTVLRRPCVFTSQA